MNKKDIHEYDVVVIGGGISGCEASYISAVNGARTLLISINTDSIGYMAFENIISNEKGIDAAGKSVWNELALNTAAKNNSIEINNIKTVKIDNTKDMIIIDRKRQMMALKGIIESQENIAVRQGLVTELVLKGNIYHTLTNDGTSYRSKVIIMAPGTFLDSNIFWGSYSIAAGRPGEIASRRLLRNLIKKGFKFKDAKLYCGPKIDGRTVDIKKYIRYQEEQKLNIVPEGKETNEMYVDGLNSAGSEKVQLKALREIRGLENAVMTRPGYGIKHNALSPLQIDKNLESIIFPGLFFCGRVNGILEYESTAAQGYIAGLNAIKKIK